ncbi:hypothetical protein I8920_15815 (plasmid) [Curtobacterium sp. YC1]|jgi:hypothetical protein|uniref:hypothetical protein n=1 Tax=Curtobacterium TaxID=2034 RepID=UPI000DAACB6E|nr:MULTISPECIES: hypothetical protein [Curtobacterium]MBB1198650.1 hypothetical protein [Curtobacterium flaccumfaciens]QQD77937.1 hypothetical protein I8920_15815 [Curtobacterium sp. YC1]WIE70279.1 hypothetical protein DEJ08_018740 [Curtobacterium sp. MCLR17_054]WIE85132.1 hypothetical protein DEJ29_018070 [Curtobacterium sp. MCPF17_021]
MNVLYTLTVLAANFDTSGEQPPGVDGISTVIRWIAWGVAGACVIGVLFGLGYLGNQRRRGETPEHLQGIIISMIAAGSTAAVGGLIGALAG